MGRGEKSRLDGVSPYRLDEFRLDGVSPYRLDEFRLDRVSPYRGGILTSPPQRFHHSLTGPTIGLFHQPFAQRIFTNIIPFFRVALLPSQPVMKRMRLPSAMRILMDPPELPFPKRHPFLQGKSQILRRAEKMQMVRHEQVITDQPCLCRLPRCAEVFMHGGIRNPRFSSIRTNRQKNNSRLC